MIISSVKEFAKAELTDIFGAQGDTAGGGAQDPAAGGALDPGGGEQDPAADGD